MFVKISKSDKSKEYTKRESIFSNIKGVETKTLEDGSLVKSGFIATTHLDSGWYDEDRGLIVRDKISKDTLELWANEINEGNPRSNKMSILHNRESHVAGVMVKGSAIVEPLDGGEYGLYVDTKVDKTKDNFEETNYRMSEGFLDSFSIEYDTGLSSQGRYYPGAVQEFNQGDFIMRELLPGTKLEGATYASQPMNEHAIMLKEVMKNKKKIIFNEVKEDNNKMNDEKIEKNEDETSEEIEEDKSTKKGVEKKEEAPTEEPEAEEEVSDEPISSPEEVKEFRKFKQYKAKEAKTKEIKDITAQIRAELKEDLDKMEVKQKVKVNAGADEKTIEFKQILSKTPEGKNVYDVNLQYKMAGQLADSLGLTDGYIKMDSKPAEAREYKNFMINGTKLEYKGLGITTNQNTDTDYLLSSAELSDVFDPIIYNHLNQKVTTWNLLPKDDFSNKGNNQVQFTIKTAKNTSAQAYLGNAITLGNVTRQKYMTKFKKYQVGVEVDGDMIAAARGGPIGDVFAQEVRDSTDDLMEVMNQALFAEVGAETAAGVIGFEYIADGVGNGTLYNVTRSAANQLLATTATDTYINGASADITIGNLRASIRNAIEEGASLDKLFFVGSPIQYDKVKAIYDDLQRLAPVSSRFGFEGRIEFESVPFFYDKDCNDDDIFLIDTETHRIAMWVPPTLEMLGKDSDSQKGFIKTYWATYNRAPRRLVMIYGNATT